MTTVTNGNFVSVTSAMQNFAVYPAKTFIVTNGVNVDEALGPASELEVSDTYQLVKSAARARMSVTRSGDQFFIADDSEIGTPGDQLHLDSALTFMAASGRLIEALTLVETDKDGLIENTYLLPFAAIEAEVDHTLITVDTDHVAERLAGLASVAFTRGTRITMADGQMKAIEELKIGDRVLTRDHGPQKIRWIGAQTVRATGNMAPIVIKKGAMHNQEDLTLSPNHRIFIYQRKDTAQVGQSEVLVRARLLVNGVTVVQSEGGYVDYFQLLFDNHEIIYAEGIAAESLYADEMVRPTLPKEVRARLNALGQKAKPAKAYELREGALAQDNAAALFSRNAV